MTLEDWTQLWSSVNRRTPASAISPMSVSASPASSLVIAPAGSTSHSPALSARFRTSMTTAALSATGSVFGIAHTAVYPPAAAARDPVSTVSLCSYPGSRRWACRSTRPGAITRPSPSRTSALPGSSPGPTAWTCSSSIRTSVTASCPPAGSTRRTPRNSVRSGTAGLPSRVGAIGSRAVLVGGSGAVAAEHQVQKRHPDCDPVRDLIGDDRPGKVGHVGGDLDATVHRAGVHDHGRLGHRVRASARQAEQARVLTHAREELLALALPLHPQHVTDVQLGKGPVEVV